MPPKCARNVKSKKDLPKPHESPKATIVSTASGLDPEAENQFELELCWCIQQLEASLISGKLQTKQMQNIVKHLHSLKSNSASLIKKRQIMKNTLGDYREKMIEDERKFSKTVSNVKFTSSGSVNKKFTFIRKATSALRHNTEGSESWIDDHKTQDELISTKTIVSSNCDSNNRTPFQFNFQTC